MTDQKERKMGLEEIIAEIKKDLRLIMIKILSIYKSRWKNMLRVNIVKKYTESVVK